jgi:ATP-dependent Clp protease ATP-binding subunit ClpB
MDVIRHIVDIKIDVIRQRLLSKNIELEISQEALSYLSREGYNPHYGARPLGRLIQNKILNPIATFIISKGVKKGDVVTVNLKDNDLVIEMKKKKIKSNIKVAKPSPYNK